MVFIDDDYNDDDDDYDYDDDDYLHPSRHIVPLCTIGDSTREIVARSTPTHDAMTVGIKYAHDLMTSDFIL